MKAKYFLWLILLSTTIFCNDFTNHDLILIKKIPVGSEPGQIGFGGIITGWIGAPKCFTISSDNTIYVPDVGNFRINIYDYNLNIVNTIKKECGNPCSFAKGLKINKNSIFCFASEYGILKMDQNGKEIYLLDKKDIPSNAINSHHFFLINDYLFFYDQNSYVRCINEEGNVLGNKNSIKILDEINNKLTPTDIRKEDDIISEIKKERKKIIFNDEFYTNQYHKFKDYYKMVKGNLKDKYNINYKEIQVERLIDYDEDHNSYWYFAYRKSKENKKIGIVIYSNTGNVIDAFHTSDLPFPENSITGRTAIAPNGDVFFMKLGGEFYYFYKIERKW